LFLQKSIKQEIKDKMAEVLSRPCALWYDLLTTFRSNCLKSTYQSGAGPCSKTDRDKDDEDRKQFWTFLKCA